MNEIEHLDRIETKIDILIDGQHAHALRFVPLEADLLRRTNRRNYWLKTIGSAVAVIVATAFLTAFGLHR